MKHVHTCPKCFERAECDDDCTIEHDLGLTSDGLPRGAHVECPACSLFWTRSEALEFCANLEGDVARIGFHVGMRGGVLFAGSSAHDLDIVIYPHDSTVCRVDDLYRVLCRAGLERQKTVAQVHEGWRLYGSRDEKHVEIWTFGDRVIDIFYAGFDPYAGPDKTFSVWGFAAGSATARFFDYDRTVQKCGLDKHRIEASDPLTAAEIWIARDADQRCDYNDRVAVVCDECGKTVAIVDVECVTDHKFKGKVRA